MSWSRTYASKKDFDADHETTGATKEEADQIKLARNVAAHLYQSGAIGAGDAKITLGGHANPKHEPAKGFASENINVSVTYAPHAPPAADAG